MLPEPDEAPLARRSCGNGLPLFRLALLREADLAGAWEAGMHAAFVAPDRAPPPHLLLDWAAAWRNLARAVERAPTRPPALAAPRASWAAERLGGGAAWGGGLAFAAFAVATWRWSRRR